MKSFRDRNPYAVGIVSMAVIVALVGAAFLVGILHLFEDTYTVRAVFRDASGIRAGDEVRVAGVKSGRVTGVAADRRNGTVTVSFEVDRGVELGPETTAEIALETLLGSKYLRLGGDVHEPFLHTADDPLIPVDRTRTPFDVFELTKIGTRAIQETDTEALNELVSSLADVTEGKRDEIRQLVTGLADFSGALAERDAQLRSLLERADRLSGVLAEKDQVLAALLEQSEGVLGLIAQRRADLAAGLRNGAVAVEQLSGILQAHRTELDFILETLHPTLETIAAHESDVDRALAWLGLGSLGLAKAPSHGPWADIYVRAVGPDFIALLQNLTGNEP